MPVIVKNLLIINGLMYLFLFASEGIRTWMINNLSLHFPLSEHFNPAQVITYMFMHSPVDIGHLLFNMFGLWMFGTYIENTWGAKRFLTYYMICGIGAAAIQLGVNYVEYLEVAKHLTPEQISDVLHVFATHPQDAVVTSPDQLRLHRIVNGPTLGASGAIYGLLAAYGYLYPNSVVQIYFLIPMKAKYFVLIMMAVSLVMGLMGNPGDHVAHFAHLGGGLVGFLYLYFGKLKSRMRRY